MSPRLLLLDEPMAGTGREETEAFIALLGRLKGRFPMILVEHDMTAVFALADDITVMIYGRVLARARPTPCATTPPSAAYLGDAMDTRDNAMLKVEHLAAPTGRRKYCST